MEKLQGTPLLSRLSTKMVAGFIAIVAVFSGLGLLVSRELNQVQQDANEAVGRSEGVYHLQEAKAAAAEQTQALYQLVIENDPQKIAEFMDAGQRRQDAINEARQHAATAQELGWLNDLDLVSASFDDNFLHEMVPAWQAGDRATAINREKISDGYLDRIAELTGLLTTNFNSRNVEARTAADQAAAEARAYLVFAGFIGLSLSLIITAVAVRRINRPITELKRASLAMTRGELDRRVEIKTSDEIAAFGEIFNLMADSVEQKIRQLTNLSDIALAISSELDWERLVGTVMKKGMELTSSQAAAIVLYDREHKVFTDTYTKGLSDSFVARMQFRPGGLAESVLLGDKAVFSDDLHAPHRLSRLAREEGIRAFICLPLKVRQKKLGVLYVYSKEVEAYGKEELSILSILSNQAAIAIQNARMFERTQEEAVTDGLTGLYNQRYFFSRLGEEIERSSRTRKPLSVIFCDLDKFKNFNDINGHALGDQVLREVARIMTESKRAIDIAARYGGEEFALILPETDTSGAQIIAHRIRRRVAGFAFRAKSRSSANLTISIGVASYPGDALQIQELLDKADWSMYHGKRQGGNRVVLFHEESSGYGKEKPFEGLVNERLHLAAIQALAASVDQRSSFCQRHAESVARLAADIAQAMELPEDDIHRVRVAGLLHDIGFVSVPEDIINKRGQLTPDEWERIKQHPETGAVILRHIARLESFLPAIRHHHEHYDGQGYPDGISRDEIPVGARIIAVADAYQAMVCDRPYRKALTTDLAIRELEMGSGTQFDPDVVEVLVDLLRARETIT